MTTPIYPLDISTAVTVTTANAIASAAYAVAADKLTLDGTGSSFYADFSLVPSSMSTAPTYGSFNLIAVDWALDGTIAGPAPTASLIGRFVGAFSPMPAIGNALTTWSMTIQKVLVTRKTDFYLFNNGTAQSLPVGSVLKAQRWTPST